MEHKLHDRINKIQTTELKSDTPSDKEIALFEALPIISKSVEEYLILTDNGVIIKINPPKTIKTSVKVHWLDPLKIGLTGQIGLKFLNYHNIFTQEQLQALIKKYLDCRDVIPSKYREADIHKLYFFACLSGRYDLSLEDLQLISQDEQTVQDKNYFLIGGDNSVRMYYIWVLFPLFISVIPEDLRKKFWKDSDKIAKLIEHCQKPSGYLPLERLKSQKSADNYKISDKHNFCSNKYEAVTLNFISDVISFVVDNPKVDLSHIMFPADAAEKILIQRREIENYTLPEKVNRDILTILVEKIKAYDNIPKRKLRKPIRAEDRKKLLPSKCYVCNETLNRLNLSAGHIESAAHNGASTLDNLVPLCVTCNSSIGSVNLYEYLFVEKKLDKVPENHRLIYECYYRELSLLTKIGICDASKDYGGILNDPHIPLLMRFKLMSALTLFCVSK